MAFVKKSLDLKSHETMVSKENASIYFLEKMRMNSQERRTQSKGRERALEAESPGSVFRLGDLDHVS